MKAKELDTPDFHSGLVFAVEALAIVLGISVDDFSHDAATETIEGDLMAVMANALDAKFGEEWRDL